ncbi:MAG TPA: 2-phosphosulfolactate phosphatase [Gaiellaceae bacterium]|nr:2-phosphosulfolactate phosphatase [Gaiellaceae bacterium]
MRIDVAFTPAEEGRAEVGVVVDVMRATSTIAQALASGYERVLCCAAVDDARRLKEEIGDAVLGGERSAVRIGGFDLGASPREFLEPKASTAILSTTNGTRTILEAVSRCEEVLLGSLLNLGAVADAVRARGLDAVVLCAGFQGAFAIDDAYCAGRIVRGLDGATPTDAAIASGVIADRFRRPIDGINARTYGPPGLEADIEWCSRVDTITTVPCFSRMVGPAAEIVAS